MEKKDKRKNYLHTKSIFIISIVVVFVTIMSIWLIGLGQNRTIFNNSIISTTVISTVFFVFIIFGLYKGFTIMDNVGNITEKISIKKGRRLADMASSGEVIAVGEGIEGIILSILLWIVVTLIIGVLLWLFGAFLWAIILIFVAALYWIFFRALKLVFKNAAKCKGDLPKSISYALFYTLLYNFWIYGLILLIDKFKTF